jgi:hypothetical protein
MATAKLPGGLYIVNGVYVDCNNNPVEYPKPEVEAPKEPEVEEKKPKKDK